MSALPKPASPALRAATLTDKPALMAMWRDLYEAVRVQGGVQARFDLQRQRIELALDEVLLQRVRGVCLVVGRPADAFTLWAVTDSDPHPTLGLFAEALATYVSPPLRRQGVASMLYAEACARLHAMGVHSLVALTEATNEPMRAMLGAQGFTPAQIVYTASLGQHEEK